eukprot:NODE_3083_length_708_cov_119.329287_g2177_i0.p1 GENE.NODE_3083_length_708_cov_119.329287_g2177_i0~~NODE_3083_length_708_cov_119.329287_g2177_i0.p1  ORF type:complete len:155 (-),score=73.72 NODE_3083_length_708_cov_119.329287_g2177_i0:244-684(-)
MGSNGDQQVTLDELNELYDVSNHPDVVQKKRTPQQVLQEFAGSWDKDGNATVTFEEFCDYYADLSAGIDDDVYFELMIRNAWHISGGTGKAANTSCRRVLVTKADGSQTVEEIKDDIRIGPKDMEGMKENLRQQGVTDIKHIQLYG